MATLSFAGIASGLDTQALVDATTNASRQTRVKPDQDRVSKLESANTAFEELSTKLDALRDTLQNFTSLSGGGVAKTGTSSKESVVSATAEATAFNGSYAVTVSALATNHTYSFDNTYTDVGNALQSSLTGSEPEADRTVSFTVGTGTEQETVDIVVSDGSFTVQDFVDEFNGTSQKARASLVNTGTSASPAYKIVISSLYEGTEKGTITRSSLGSSLTNLSAFSENAAANSSVTISGIGTLTRPTNTITDVIPGVSLELNSLGSSTVKIAEDATSTVSKVQDFIDIYNDIVQFVGSNNAITREENGEQVTNTFAPLASTRVDDNVLEMIRTEIGSAVASSGTTVRIFADLGITTQRDGTLAFDTAKLQTAISSEVSSVSSVFQSFADSVATTGGVIDQYTRFNGLLDVTINANKTTISDLNKRISDAEASIERQAEALRLRYARLESVMGRLQNQQQSLSSALAGLG